ncbi:cobalamin biosynthesis protein CbiL [Phaeovulum vinaykumarii]|uniref:cobalamin biosynthesis protein CbiL n=1 Tax=Phaeovulum vinaykumarii TaxID=407234 RepID=UPI001F1D7CF9|nr:cobalamin biosynthesis protein CbiL [Phaeovulum vinaykumarii]
MPRSPALLLAPLLILLLALVSASPAAAHALRVFARLEGDQISGYGFFIGGGRPRDVEWVAQMGGAPLARGRTDAEGAFRFPVPEPVTGDLKITVNTAEGHIASTTLAQSRLLPAQGAPGATTPSAQLPGPATTGPSTTGPSTTGPAYPGQIAPQGLRPAPAAPAPAAPPPTAPAQPATAQPTTAEIERAVAAQVAPVLERLEQMDARMRLTDLVAGLSLIFGIAGMLLWARSRRP